MIHSSEQALEAARNILEKNNIKHISVDAPVYKPDWENTTDVWWVCYTYMVFQEENAFIYLDDRNGLKLIYILTNHGYLKY
jgi:hypothetical protein